MLLRLFHVEEEESLEARRKRQPWDAFVERPVASGGQEALAHHRPALRRQRRQPVQLAVHENHLRNDASSIQRHPLAGYRDGLTRR